MPAVQFAINSYQARALPISAQRLVNFYAESLPQDAKSPVVLYGSPGLKSFAVATNGAPCRGQDVMAGLLYEVRGNRLYSVTSAGVYTDLGSIGSSSGRVSMDHNNAATPQLCIVDGQDGWIYDTTNGLQQITDASFKPSDQVVFIDGYFAFKQNGTGKWFISNNKDGLTYTGTDFAEAEGDPDDLISIITLNRFVLLLGAKTTEPWFNTGASGFPFERNSSVFIERGSAAVHSVAKDNEAVFWLGDDLIIYTSAGGQPIRISQYAMEEAVRGYTASTAYGYTYTQAGHKWYVLTFPDDKATWVYDIGLGLWHERESIASGFWRASHVIAVYGKLLAGDAIGGNLGELDLDTYDEYGDLILAHAAGPPNVAEGKRMFFSKFELDVESGTGLSNGQGSDPVMWLDWSDDGGRTWSNAKPFMSIGKIGEYKQRMRVRRLGSAFERVFRVSVSDPVKRSILAVYQDMHL